MKLFSEIYSTYYSITEKILKNVCSVRVLILFFKPDYVVWRTIQDITQFF